MTLDAVEGLPVENLAETAANGEFTGNVTRPDTAGRQSGWDPYEVWRTRVRTPSKAAPGRENTAARPAALIEAPTR
jgi:hypothetical protein